MSFSYQWASIEQIAKHFTASSRSTISEALRYYQARNDFLTVEKIEAAKGLMKAEKKSAKQTIS